MSLTIELSPHDEHRLREEAARQGVPPEELVLRAVKQIFPASNEEAIRALESVYDEGDESEQRETWDYLKQALDEDRLSYRKLFP